MAYECLKDEPPFVRGAIEDQIRNKVPEPLANGIHVAESVMAGLAKKPGDRPPTCVEVLEACGFQRRAAYPRLKAVLRKRKILAASPCTMASAEKKSAKVAKASARRLPFSRFSQRWAAALGGGRERAMELAARHQRKRGVAHANPGQLAFLREEATTRARRAELDSFCLSVGKGSSPI